MDGTVNCAKRDDTRPLLAGTAGCAGTATATATADFSSTGLIAFFSAEVIEVDKAGVSFFLCFAGNGGAALVFTADLTAVLDTTGVADDLTVRAGWVAAALELDLPFGAGLAGIGAAFFRGAAVARVAGLPTALTVTFGLTLAATFGTTLATVLGATLGATDREDDFAAGLAVLFDAALGVPLLLPSLFETGTGALVVALALALLTGLVFTSDLLDGAACACSGSRTGNRLLFTTRPLLATPFACRF